MYAVGVDLRGLTHRPAIEEGPLFVAGQGERRDNGRTREGDWSGEWSARGGHGGWVLRRAVAGLAAGLDGPGLGACLKHNGGEVRAGDVELVHLALGEGVAQEGEGGDLPAEVVAGSDSLAGGRGHLQQGADAAEDQGAGCGGLAVGVEMEAGAIEGSGEEMPLAGSDVCGAGELVVLAHPERDLAGIDGEIAGVLGRGAAHAGDELECGHGFTRFDPAEEGPGRIGQQHGVVRIGDGHTEAQAVGEEAAVVGAELRGIGGSGSGRGLRRGDDGA